MISAKKTNKPKYDFHSESRNFLRKHTTRKIILNEIRLYLKRLILLLQCKYKQNISAN